MASSPRWFGRVTLDGTRVELFQRPLYQRWLKSKAGKLVTVIIDVAVKRRSSQQNAYWWSTVVRLFAERCGYLQSEHECVHDELVRLLLGTRQDSHPSFPIRRSTTTLSTKEFSDLIEAAQMLAADKLGLVIPDPDPEWFLRRTHHERQAALTAQGQAHHDRRDDQDRSGSQPQGHRPQRAARQIGARARDDQQEPDECD